MTFTTKQLLINFKDCVNFADLSRNCSDSDSYLLDLFPLCFPSSPVYQKTGIRAKSGCDRIKTQNVLGVGRMFPKKLNSVDKGPSIG